MNVDHVRQGFGSRITEARTLLSLARNLDAEGAGHIRSSSGAMLKGYVFVALYGALEYTVTHGSQTYLNFLTDKEIRPTHLRRILSSVALDAPLTAAKDAGHKRKWSSRRAIFERFESNDPCVLSDSVFGTFLHNVWPDTIQEIFNCFAIADPITPEARDIPYLREIVDKRNEIAHGRSSAEEVGSRSTTDDLQVLLDATYSTCLHFITTLQENAASKTYLEPRYRRYYP